MLISSRASSLLGLWDISRCLQGELLPFDVDNRGLHCNQAGDHASGERGRRQGELLLQIEIYQQTIFRSEFVFCSLVAPKNGDEITLFGSSARIHLSHLFARRLPRYLSSGGFSDFFFRAPFIRIKSWLHFLRACKWKCVYRAAMAVNYISDSLRPVILWDFDLHFVIRVGAQGGLLEISDETPPMGFSWRRRFTRAHESCLNFRVAGGFEPSW